MAQVATETPPGIAQILGANVYRLRVLKVPYWSRGKLSAVSGIHRETLRMIEEARDPAKETKSNPRASTIEALAAALGVPVAELLRWDAATPSYLSGQRLTLVVDPTAKPSKVRRAPGQRATHVLPL